MTEIVLTNHARNKMAARGISFTEVREVLLNYRNRWSSTHYRGRRLDPGTFVYQGETLAVVVREEPGCLVVITVLLKRSHQWDDEEARTRRSS